jgi:hypothetical protein
MPFPRVVVKINRYWIIPIVRCFEGRVLPFMLIHHVGRRGGKTFETPVWAFRNDNHFIIALTYGTAIDWFPNFAGDRTLRGERLRRALPDLAAGGGPRRATRPTVAARCPVR